MARSSERILTSHVGSLVRPAALRTIMAARAQGTPYDEAQLGRELKTAVADVVAKQAEIGLDIVNDGEFGKAGWNRYVVERMDGFVQRPPKPGETPRSNFDLSGEAKAFPGFYAAYAVLQEFDWEQGRLPPPRSADQLQQRMVWECVGPIQYKSGAVQRDIANFKAALPSKDGMAGFMPAASPMSARGLWINSYYKDEDAVAEALAGALSQEYRAIVDAGLFLQIDDPYLADHYARIVVEKNDREAQMYLERHVALLNHALAGISEEKVRYHVCWGSWNGPHTFDVPLAKLVPLIVKVRARAYSLEAANPRHEHEWTLWKDVRLPDGKALNPGVVSHCTNVVEHPELVAQRLSNFANVVGRDNIIAGTDCGFSQSHDHMRVHSSIQWAKLSSLVEGARLASAQLWRR
jgi:5-methyltetrahydropteroyltriglutamate--homocysteine methyltransferase